MADDLQLTEVLQRAVKTNAKFYKGFLDLSLEYLRGISEIFGEPEAETPDADGLEPDAGALVLESEAGSTASGAFLVTNDLGRNVSCEFVTSKLADPDGARVFAKAVFEPAKLDLDPGQQQVVRVMILVDTKLAAGVAYTGEVAIKGLDGFTVPVVLRRLHSVEDSPAEPDPAKWKPAAGSKSAPKTPRRKKARKANTAKKRGPRARKKSRPR